MQQYLDFMRHVRDHGQVKTDRTGTGTVSVFGYQMRFNLQDGFPLVTTKLHLKSIIHELMVLGRLYNIKYLKENGVSIWDEWADENGELGRSMVHSGAAGLTGWRPYPIKSSNCLIKSKTIQTLVA